MLPRLGHDFAEFNNILLVNRGLLFDPGVEPIRVVICHRANQRFNNLQIESSMFDRQANEAEAIEHQRDRTAEFRIVVDLGNHGVGTKLAGFFAQRHAELSSGQEVGIIPLFNQAKRFF